MKKKYKELCRHILYAVDWYRIGDDEHLEEICKFIVIACKVEKLAKRVNELIKDKDKT